MDVGANQLFPGELESFPKMSAAVGPNCMWIALPLLILWDATTVFLSGSALALVYDTIIPPDGPLALHGGLADLPALIRLSLVGGLLTPLTLGDGALQDTSAIPKASMRVVVLLGLILAVGFLTRTLIYVPRAWMLGWSVAIFACVISGRLLFRRFIDTVSARWPMRERVAVVGDPPIANRVAAHLRQACGNFIDVVGVFADDTCECAPETGTGRLSMRALVDAGQHSPLDRIVLAMTSADSHRIDSIVSALKALCVDIVWYPGLGISTHSMARVLYIGGLPTVTLATRPIGPLGLLIKTAGDKALSLLLLAWLFPLLLIIAAAIRLDSPGPVLFRQKRQGLNNAEFDILKFRTMTWSASVEPVIEQTKRHDQRVTRVGRFLRRSSLDELPQLLNVLRGDMSLVGPRPHPITMRTENRLGTEIVSNYEHRHRVRPGMTGWAQINGWRGATHTVDQITQRIEHDNWYIDHWSLALDLKILALTPIRMILDDDGAY